MKNRATRSGPGRCRTGRRLRGRRRSGRGGSVRRGRRRARFERRVGAAGLHEHSSNSARPCAAHRAQPGAEPRHAVVLASSVLVVFAGVVVLVVVVAVGSVGPAGGAAHSWSAVSSACSRRGGRRRLAAARRGPPAGRREGARRCRRHGVCRGRTEGNRLPRARRCHSPSSRLAARAGVSRVSSAWSGSGLTTTSTVACSVVVSSAASTCPIVTPSPTATVVDATVPLTGNATAAWYGGSIVASRVRGSPRQTRSWPSTRCGSRRPRRETDRREHSPAGDRDGNHDDGHEQPMAATRPRPWRRESDAFGAAGLLVRFVYAVAPEFDSLIAKVVAWGRDRAEALARLRWALTRTVVVIEGGTTNRSFLLSLLDSAALRNGDVDNHWLDEFTASGVARRADCGPDGRHRGLRRRRGSSALGLSRRHRRGRPDDPGSAGHRTTLRYRGYAHNIAVFRTHPDTYLIESANAAIEVGVRRFGPYERLLTVAGRTYHVVVSTQRSSFLIDVDNTTHRVQRDDGGVVRAGWPAFVISVLVQPGDWVDTGDPLVVLESIEMETTVTAPFAGEVADVLVSVNTEVERTAALVRIRETQIAASSPAAWTSPNWARSPTRERSRQRPYEALHAYLMGFDLDPTAVAEVLAEQRQLCLRRPDDAGLLQAEERLLDLFADVSALRRPHPNASRRFRNVGEEHVLSYLQSLDADRAGLPAGLVRAQLLNMLGRYDVQSLDRTCAAELEEAVVWMWRSFQRTDEMVPVVTAVLERRLRYSDVLANGAQPELRALIGRLAAASQARYPTWQTSRATCSSTTRRAFARARSGRSLRGDGREHLDALRADPHRGDRDELIEQLVWCPQPLRAMLLHRWAGASAGFREVLLDAHLRRFYRIRQPLHDMQFVERRGQPLATAAGSPRSVCMSWRHTRRSRIYRLVARAIAEDLAAGDATRLVVLDLVVWRSGDHATASRSRPECGDCSAVRTRPTAAPGGHHRHERGHRGRASANAPLHVPPAAWRVRRGNALSRTSAPDDRQAAGPVAAVQLHLAAVAVRRGRVSVPRGRARQRDRRAVLRDRRGARPDTGAGRGRSCSRPAVARANGAAGSGSDAPGDQNYRHGNGLSRTGS